MLPETEKHVRKFQQETEVYLDTRDLKEYWVITARLPKGQGEVHHTHRSRKYVSSRNMDGAVLVLPDPEISPRYTVESWGEMNRFEDFVEKAMDRIRGDMDLFSTGSTGECGTSCD
jgi:hypothetical protein